MLEHNAARTIRFECCISSAHCKKTDAFQNECDYLKLSWSVYGTEARVALCFIVLMLADPLSEDIADATVEEALLDYGTEQPSLKLGSLLLGKLLILVIRGRHLGTNINKMFCGRFALTLLCFQKYCHG